MTHKRESLESFVARIETRLKQSGAYTDTLEKLICRHLTGVDAKVAAALVMKCVEWKYGKPTERHEHSGVDGGVIEHTIKFEKA
jgi:hypothetical protein